MRRKNIFGLVVLVLILVTSACGSGGGGASGGNTSGGASGGSSGGKSFSPAKGPIARLDVTGSNLVLEATSTTIVQTDATQYEIQVDYCSYPNTDKPAGLASVAFANLTYDGTKGSNLVWVSPNTAPSGPLDLSTGTVRWDVSVDGTGYTYIVKANPQSPPKLVLANPNIPAAHYILFQYSLSSDSTRSDAACLTHDATFNIDYVNYWFNVDATANPLTTKVLNSEAPSGAHMSFRVLKGVTRTGMMFHYNNLVITGVGNGFAGRSDNQDGGVMHPNTRYTLRVAPKVDTTVLAGPTAVSLAYTTTDTTSLRAASTRTGSTDLLESPFRVYPNGGSNTNQKIYTGPYVYIPMSFKDYTSGSNATKFNHILYGIGITNSIYFPLSIVGDKITGGTTHAVINPPFAGLGSALDVFTTGGGTNGFQTANKYPLNGPYNSFLYSDTDLGRENYYAASIYNVSAGLTEQKHFNESPVMGLSTFCGGITDYWYNLVFSFPATVTKPTNYVHYDDDCFIINGPTTGGSSFPNN